MRRLTDNPVLTFLIKKKNQYRTDYSRQRNSLLDIFVEKPYGVCMKVPRFNPRSSDPKPVASLESSIWRFVKLEVHGSH